MLQGGLLSLRDDNGLRIESTPGPVRVQQLISAEAALQPPGFKVQVLLNGRVLPRSAKLSFAPHGPVYQLRLQRKAAALDFGSLPGPAGPCCPSRCGLQLCGDFAFGLHSPGRSDLPGSTDLSS